MDIFDAFTLSASLHVAAIFALSGDVPGAWVELFITATYVVYLAVLESERRQAQAARSAVDEGRS